MRWNPANLYLIHTPNCQSRCLRLFGYALYILIILLLIFHFFSRQCLIFIEDDRIDETDSLKFNQWLSGSVAVSAFFGAEINRSKRSVFVSIV